MIGLEKNEINVYRHCQLRTKERNNTGQNFNLLSCDGVTFLGILIVYTEGIIHACRQNIIFKFYNWYHTDIIKSSDIKISGNKVWQILQK